MNFRLFSENPSLYYSYSANLDKASEVTFTLALAKDRVFKNTVTKADIKQIGIAEGLSE